MNPANPPEPGPTVHDLIKHPAVAAAVERAWIDSRADDPDLRHEEGGWIYLNLISGEILTRRVSAGSRAELIIGVPPIVVDSVVIGTFHTHPNPSSEGWRAGPSVDDEQVHDLIGVPGIIRADNGIHTTGPISRRGGLAGPPGFPLTNSSSDAL